MIIILVLTHPPKMTNDSNGQLIEVVLSADDFMTYLRSLTQDADWDTLPNYLQAAIDRVLIDEVRIEKDTARDLEDILAVKS